MSEAKKTNHDVVEEDRKRDMSKVNDAPVVADSPSYTDLEKQALSLARLKDQLQRIRAERRRLMDRVSEIDDEIGALSDGIEAESRHFMDAVNP